MGVCPLVVGTMIHRAVPGAGRWGRLRSVSRGLRGMHTQRRCSMRATASPGCELVHVNSHQVKTECGRKVSAAGIVIRISMLPGIDSARWLHAPRRPCAIGLAPKRSPGGTWGRHGVTLGLRDPSLDTLCLRLGHLGQRQQICSRAPPPFATFQAFVVLDRARPCALRTSHQPVLVIQIA